MGALMCPGLRGGELLDSQGSQRIKVLLPAMRLVVVIRASPQRSVTNPLGHSGGCSHIRMGATSSG
ncbi:hypothetical protein E0E62_15955 [Streptomyces sp. 16-176A]